MTTEEWLVGWREIGSYIGKSAITAQRYAKKGLPFLRDPGGRPMSKPSMIDEYVKDMNRDMFDEKKWRDKGIDTAIANEDYREKQKKDFDERFLEAQRPVRGRF